MAENDLTRNISPFLDNHLVVPLLEFLKRKQIYKDSDIDAALLDTLSKTQRVDAQIELSKKLGKDVPKEVSNKQQSIKDTMTKYQERTKKLMEFVTGNTEEVEKLRSEKNFNATYLISNNITTAEQIQQVYQNSKFYYECGEYASAAESLSVYLSLSVGSTGERNANYLSALWGKLAADILSSQWEAASLDLEDLRESIESTKFESPIEQLQQRAWLLHWSLFVNFRTENGSSNVVELFFQSSYLNTIQTTCPHLLKYLTCAVITNTQRRRSEVNDLVRILQQEEYSYQDPLTDFLKCLLIDFDFEGAQQKLSQCETLISNDYFLENYQEAFLENARLFIFETYCRIHQCIDIQMLADKLSIKDKEEAELWIVNLIRNAKLDAKIDSERGQVIMGNQYPTFYEQVIDKTKSLYFQSNQLASYLLQE